MNAFAEIFDSTTAFLRTKGITPKIFKGKKASRAAVEQFRKRTGVALPENFSAFFTDFANGFTFRWEMSEEVWGVFLMSNLDLLAEEQQEWQGCVRSFLDNPTSLDRCVRPPFRAEAFKIWQKMDSWVPFWDEGNGDHFCVEIPSGRVLYDQHDWFDGFGSLAKTNGIVAGQSLEDFLRNWSRFCFKDNENLWWGKFREAGAIQWKPQYFGVDFYRGD